MASPEQCQKQFKRGVELALYFWPALSLAVAQNWGGPDSSKKRLWFAAVTADLFDDPETEAVDVEDRLLQVMLDEFEVAVEDESERPVAETIMKLSKACGKGDFRMVQEMEEGWERKRGGEGDIAAAFHRVEAGENDQDTDGSDEEDEDGDIDMDEAPELVRPPRKKPVPEVDEDGFTKVVGKNKR